MQRRLLALRKGNKCVDEHVFKFRTLGASSSWPADILHGAFLNFLNDSMKDQLTSQDEMCSFEDLVSLILRFDN